MELYQLWFLFHSSHFDDNDNNNEVEEHDDFNVGRFFPDLSNFGMKFMGWTLIYEKWILLELYLILQDVIVNFLSF